jgi:hypothetical protein
MDVLLLLKGADLTRTQDNDWPVGTIWFDPDAETGGLPTIGGTGSVDGPDDLTSAGSGVWTPTPGFQHAMVQAPPNQGGAALLFASAILDTGPSAFDLEIRFASPVVGGMFKVQVPSSAAEVTRSATLAGLVPLAAGTLVEAYVEHRFIGSAPGTDPTLLSTSVSVLFIPGAVASEVQSDPWGRYWNGASWIPSVLQGAVIEFEE